MHRFMIAPGVSPVAGDRIALPREEAEHLSRVLRLKAGDAVEVFDGVGGAWSGEVWEVSKVAASVRVTGSLESREPRVRVTLYQGLPKADKLELIIQKATELGVYAVVPVVMERSVARAESGGNKAQRWRRIAMEAAKQCGRARVPEVLEPVAGAELGRRLAGHALALMPYEMERGVSLRGALEDADARGGLRGAVRGEAGAAYAGDLPVCPPSIALIIGPEGGITPDEASAWASAGARPVTLGPRILRTETAAIATLGMVMYHTGGMEPEATP